MARRTDRQHVSEAIRLQRGPVTAWTQIFHSAGANRISGLAVFARGPKFTERLHIRYGNLGQIVEASYWPPEDDKVLIASRRRERVLAIIGGDE